MVMTLDAGDLFQVPKDDVVYRTTQIAAPKGHDQSPSVGSKGKGGSYFVPDSPAYRARGPFAQFYHVTRIGTRIEDTTHGQHPAIGGEGKVIQHAPPGNVQHARFPVPHQVMDKDFLRPTGQTVRHRFAIT